VVVDDLLAILAESGLDTTEIVERRDERNGARVMLYAARSRPGR
jgi:hypothetical protein